MTKTHLRWLSVLFIFLIVVLLDLGVGTLFKNIKGFPYSATVISPYPWEVPADPQLKTMKEDAMKYRRSNPFYHHGLQPMTSWDASWGPLHYRMHTNSLGMRDENTRTVSPAPEFQRLVIIGDSFTEGVGVSYSDSFVGRISSALKTEKVEVLNAGVISYSPLLYLRRIQSLVEKEKVRFDTLVVFIDISDAFDDALKYSVAEDGSIIENKTKSLSSGGSGIVKFLKNYGIISFFISHLPEIIARKDPITNDPRALWSTNEQWYQEYGSKGLSIMGKNMSKLHELCRENSIELIVAIYPYPDQIVASHKEDYQQRFWRKWAKDKSVPLLDFYNDFIDPFNKEEDRIRIARKYFFARDTHWNPAGHAVVAESFMRFWRSRKI